MVQRSFVLCLIGVLVAFFAGYFVLHSFNYDIFQENYPPINGEARNITDFHLIYLRSNSKNLRLSIPATYLYYEIGSNGELSEEPDSTYIVSLAAKMNEDDGTFSPGSAVPRDQDRDIAVIKLTNKPADKRLIAHDKCLRVGDFKAFYGMKYFKASGCDVRNATDRRCQVSGHFDGWKLEIMMPRRYYLGEYQKYCTAAIDFLAKYKTR